MKDDLASGARALEFAFARSQCEGRKPTPVSHLEQRSVLARSRFGRVAVVHEWLQTYAGSERVLEQLLLCFPDADLFAVVDFVPDSERDFLHGHDVRTSFIQRLPFARRMFRNYLGLMPIAIQ